ncbi:MAG: hypothetical protein R3E21_06980 [Caenibius sp.]
MTVPIIGAPAEGCRNGRIAPKASGARFKKRGKASFRMKQIAAEMRSFLENAFTIAQAPRTGPLPQPVADQSNCGSIRQLAPPDWKEAKGSFASNSCMMALCPELRNTSDIHNIRRNPMVCHLPVIVREQIIDDSHGENRSASSGLRLSTKARVSGRHKTSCGRMRLPVSSPFGKRQSAHRDPGAA